MSNGFLSQEEIDSLLNGGGNVDSASETKEEQQEELSDLEKDLLGEIGNITMGSASTALSTMLNQKVNITTPVVTVTTIKRIKDEFEIPNISLEVKYTSGIVGENLLVMKTSDAAVVANLMMGGNGEVEHNSTLSEIEISAVSEAMNQMIGSAATSMATMFSRAVNISPPESKVLDENTTEVLTGLQDEDNIIKVSFSLTIGDLVDSEIMQIFPMDTGKKIVNIMMGKDDAEPSKEEVQTSNNVSDSYTPTVSESKISMNYDEPAYKEVAVNKVEVSKASFQPLEQETRPSKPMPKNIDLILDVPIEVSVVLGRTKKNIGEILSLGTGSLIELDKLAEEPVEILVNGKKIAYGEVMVVDENFGVRITSIVNQNDRIKSLNQK